MSSSAPSMTSTSYSTWSPSCSKRTRSSPVHAASLVDPSTHSPELMQLLDITLSQTVIEYIVDCVSDTVDYALGRPAHAPRSVYRHSFTAFVSTTLSRAEVAPPTVIVALAYIARARPQLEIAVERWALERAFLGALILASKYTQDSTLRNAHWAMCTGVFGKGDVGRIEREFLEVLDWELGVREAELLAHHEGLIAAASGVPVKSDLVAKMEDDVETQMTMPTEKQMDVDVDLHASSTLPELEASSPHSSSATLSPRTPLMFPASISVPTLSYSSAPSLRLSRCPAPAPPGVQRTKAGGHGRLHSLLHAFPFQFHLHPGHGHGHAVQVRA
ncbi:hypothetical protein C8R47DRAFT_526143 [Mycena vitilis]|nr:hypothetical protein C8R47DRAFT_526143 [Mycena vitilis]